MLIIVLISFPICQAESNGDTGDPKDCQPCEARQCTSSKSDKTRDCQKCESKKCAECSSKDPKLCGSNPCIICLNQQNDSTGTVIDKIHEVITLIKTESNDIKYKIDQINNKPESKKFDAGDTLALLGLIAGFAGSAFLLLSQFHWKPEIKKQVEELTRNIKEKNLPFVYSTEITLFMMDILHIKDGGEAPYPSEKYKKILERHDKKTFTIGFILLVVSFFFQIIGFLLEFHKE